MEVAQETFISSTFWKERVAFASEGDSMLQDNLYLRHASMEDAGLLYVWRNETECRKNSVNTGYIEYDSHCKWLSGKLSSGCCSIFICMREHGGDCLKTKVELSNCTKNKQKMDREAFEKTENHQKNCVECISANEFSDSLGGGMSLLDRQGWL